MELLMQLRGIQDQTVKPRNTKKEKATEHAITKMTSQETSKFWNNNQLTMSRTNQGHNSSITLQSSWHGPAFESIKINKNDTYKLRK
jgi:hypothetical protein